MGGQELKERREKLGLTRRQLAQLFRVTEDAVYRWETGSRRILPERELALEMIEDNFKKHKSAVCLIYKDGFGVKRKINTP